MNSDIPNAFYGAHNPLSGEEGRGENYKKRKENEFTTVGSMVFGMASMDSYIPMSLCAILNGGRGKGLKVKIMKDNQY